MRASSDRRGHICRSVTGAPESRSRRQKLNRHRGAVSGTKSAGLGCAYRSGAPDTIRTCDLCLRRATLYPAELRARMGSHLADWADVGNGLAGSSSVATTRSNRGALDDVFDVAGVDNPSGRALLLPPRSGQRWSNHQPAVEQPLRFLTVAVTFAGKGGRCTQMIFEQPQCGFEVQDRSSIRRELIASLARVFRLTFPMLGFRVFEKIAAINAQASVRDGLRSVDVFGGLAFHPAVGRDALVFIYLHEAGHHLGQGCRHPCNAQIACDCAADCWAITEGRGKLARNDCGFALPVALAQLEIAAKLGERSCSRHDPGRCAYSHWARRKQNLLGGLVIPKQCALL